MIDNIKDNKEFDMVGKIKCKKESDHVERQTGTPQKGKYSGTDTVE